MAEKDILAEARERFQEAVDTDSTNRSDALSDLKFWRKGEQWPEKIRLERERKGRPCLVLNKGPSFARQVINDVRQNRPAITVTGVDSQADPKTAEVLSGLIRHIERYSDADIAYDTAVDDAVYGGIGYIQIGTEYASDTGFEQEIRIQRVVNPFAIYPDCDAESADGRDWNWAFHTVSSTAAEIKRQYGEKDVSSWNETSTGDLGDEDEDDIRLARYWKVVQDRKTLVLLSNGGTITEDELTPEIVAMMQSMGVQPIGQTRAIEVPRVALYVLSGNGVLDEQKWAGRYIPIVPVYGEEFWIEGERHYKSLLRDSRSAQENFNYWRTTTTELVALQPKAPWIGAKGSFRTDAEKWATANIENHQYIEYDLVANQPPPQRQPFAGMPAGAMQEALSANDDMKAIMGIYDASLGQRSNETSGRAIMARQREGDLSTFHFPDNLVRSIRQVGRICLDLIPHIYDSARIVRIIGKDEQTETVPINQPYQTVDDQGQAIEAIHDVTVGRYDVSVRAGPSYTTQRQEAADQMVQLLQAFPAAAPYIGDIIARNLDWPGAEEIAKRLEKIVPGNQQGPDPEQVAQMFQQAQEAQAQIEQGKAEIEKGKSELEKLLADLRTQQANLKAQEAQLQAKVAQAQADLQGREMQLEVRGMQTDQRGAQMEQDAQRTGEQTALQIVQQALDAVTQKIAGLEGKLGQQGNQPIIVPIPSQGGGRRRVKVSRGPKGELMGDIEDVLDDGPGGAQ